MTRSKLNFDIDADEAQEISADDIRRATAASGFGGVSPVAAKDEANRHIKPAANSAPVVQRRGKARTGRVHQFNTRMKAETIQSIQDYADRHGLRTMIEVIELAIERLEEEDAKRKDGI